MTSSLRIAAPAWVDDQRFDIDYHVRVLPVPVPVSREQLQQIVAAQITQRLDRTRPLWQLDGDAVPDLDVIAGGIGTATDELLSLAYWLGSCPACGAAGG
jgi:hypothetical protein